LAAIERIKSEKKLIISIPDTSVGGYLRNYLNEIGFTNLSIKYGLFSYYPDHAYGGLDGKKISPLCGTLIFDKEVDEDQISKEVDKWIAPFSEAYLLRFQRYDKEKSKYINEITEFLNEIINNCREYAKSISITTMHANYDDDKIYLSISDIGCGFVSSLNDYNINSEREGILEGVYKRKKSKIYGLFNVIRRVLEFNGKVRIHSNDTQIVFTPRIYSEFVNEELLRTQSFFEFNVKNTAYYDGVHIEIEIPLKEKDKDNDKNRV
jgi:hypothetical protein